MLAAVNEKDPEFIKDYNEIRKQYKKDKAAKDYEKAKLKPVRYYGKMLYGRENSLWEKELKYKQELDKGSGSFHLTGKPYVEAQKDSYYGEPNDSSVEIPVSNAPDTNDLGNMPRFKSKIDEEIWRLKKKR